MVNLLLWLYRKAKDVITKIWHHIPSCVSISSTWLTLESVWGLSGAGVWFMLAGRATGDSRPHPRDISCTNPTISTPCLVIRQSQSHAQSPPSIPLTLRESSPCTCSESFEQISANLSHRLGFLAHLCS